MTISLPSVLVRAARVSVASIAALLLLVALLPSAASAAVLTMPTWSGDGVDVTGTRYAKGGNTLTLTVTADVGTKCVVFTGGHLATPVEDKATPYALTFTAPATGDGAQNFSAQGYDNQNCSSQAGLLPATASYTLDNTAPVVSGTLSPAANASGWNRDDATVTWSAVENGSGLASGPTPANETQSAETSGATKSTTAVDRVGNVGTGTVSVKLDKTAPTVTASAMPQANEAGWNSSNVTVSFACLETLSGLAGTGCPAAVALTENGAQDPVTRSVDDNAGNTGSTTVSNIKIDKVDPTLSGAATSDNRGTNGWYTGDVTIEWTAEDAHSGIDGAVVDSTISGEGEGLSTTKSVSDHAGNTASADSPTVRIDRTSPVTTITAPEGWRNSDATISLSATDGLSGLSTTEYTVDGGAAQTYSDPFTLGAGSHTLTYRSTDLAGNVEPARTVEVKVDKTAPSVTTSLSTPANDAGWHKVDVTVTFTCADEGGSGLEADSCSRPHVIDDEGAGQQVHGAARDNAGNPGSSTTVVSLDKTRPAISLAADRRANSNGWYDDDVTARVTCTDALSGIAAGSCPASRTFGEGADQSHQASVSDTADNSAEAAIAGINVDKTRPALEGTADDTTWHTDDVRVTWTCSDALSGLSQADACPDTTITGEGSNLSSTTTVSDRAGNARTTTVHDVRIDRTAPTTTLSLDRPAGNDGNWHDGGVTVTLNSVDTVSGVAATHYQIGDAPVQEYTAPFEHATPGISTITFWSVDRAGNIEDNAAPGHSTELKIDNLKPTITSTRLPAPNAFGWNNDPVTVDFLCNDAETGVAADECTGDATFSTEGADQVATGTATDAAGNTESANVGDINIDLTPPTLAGTATAEPNAAGWYNGDVTVDWAASDALSGLDPATVPSSSVITSQGVGLSTASVTVKDKAGNERDAAYGPVKIDRDAPTTAMSFSPDAPEDGWHRAPVTVTLDAADSLSGIGTTYYSVNGGGPIEYSVPFEFGRSGTSEVTFWSVDNAGNVEQAGEAQTLKIDSGKPTIVGRRSVAPNAGGWHNTPVTVTFECTDDVEVASCEPDVELANEGADQQATGRAVDTSGGMAETTVRDIDIDLTKPALSGAATTEPNANGWYAGDVTVAWTSSDALSGVAQNPADSLVTGEGTNLTTGPVSVADQAGNEKTVEVSGIKIDRTAPKVAVAGIAQAEYFVGQEPTATCSVNDSGSGVANTVSAVRSQAGSTVTYTCTAKDRAGNSASASKSYVVKALPPAPVFRPDALIRKAGVKTYTGNNTYSAAQTVSAKVARTEKIVFFIRIQNDGNARDTITTRGVAARTGFRVAYLEGATGTTKMAAQKSMAAGSGRTVRAVVTVTSTAKLGSVMPAGVTVASTSNTKAVDAVRGNVTATR